MNPIQAQLHQQTDALYERYGKPLEEDHWGEFIVISLDGKTVIASTLIAAAQAAAILGRGNFATWK